MRAIAAFVASFACVLTFPASIAHAQCRLEMGQIVCSDAPTGHPDFSPVDPPPMLPSPSPTSPDSFPGTGSGSGDIGGGSKGGFGGGADGGIGGVPYGGFGGGADGGIGGAPSGGFGGTGAAAGEAPPLEGVKASRSFFGPHGYPPEKFAAYGIVAFPARPTAETIDRYLAVCRAYWATLDPPSELDTPIHEQMVTVWPVETDHLADQLNADRSTQPIVCQPAVENYDLDTGKTAIRHARLASELTDPDALSGRGPFLLASSPSSEKGHNETLVLAFNLSYISQYSDILRALLAEKNSQPALCRSD